MIRSAVRTTLRSLLWSDLVAELNQTVIDVLIQWWQSWAVSAAPVEGWTSSAGEGSTASAGPFYNVVWCRWCPVIWMSPLQSQCCSWWWVGRVQGGLLKSTAISTLLSVFSSRLLRLHQTDNSWMRPISVVSSANFRSLTEVSLDVQSLVLREKSSGERTQPWGAPVLIVRVLDENFLSLTSCCLSV